MSVFDSEEWGRDDWRQDYERSKNALGIAKLTLVTMLDHADPLVRELVQVALTRITSILGGTAPDGPTPKEGL